MNSQKLLIISVIAALLMIGGAVAFVKFRNAGLSQATSSNADHVVIDEIMSSCKPNDQCIVIDTKCSFCCDFVAINAKSEALFNQMFDQTCKHYKGAYCECHDLSSYPSCVNGKCQMVKWTENKALQAPRARQGAPQAAPVATPAPPAVQQPAQVPVPQPTPQAAPVVPATQTAPVAPPATSATPAVTATPAPVPVAPTPAEPAPAEPAPESSYDAFGETETVPAEETAPVDDLYAPLPETYTPPTTPEEDGVHVIQP